MAQPPPAAKVQSGQLTCGGEVEIWSDEDQARATGLLRILDEDGQAEPARVPDLSPPRLVRLFEGMLQSRLLDELLLPLQRQGRISHYFEARGQEAGPLAGAEALAPTDYFVPGLREGAVAIYRGLPLADYLAQIFGTSRDRARGRQMPGHVSAAAVRHVSTSSCVASQIPHAVGLAMAAKIRKERTVALCCFGDGATSEDDFHAGLNFAAVYRAPVVLVCQNNQWAISTPVAAQTKAETLAAKGLAYAVPALRVDGNDVLAMYAAIRDAVDAARAGRGPTFIEAVTYRLGAHSSADDPTRYRDGSEPVVELGTLEGFPNPPALVRGRQSRPTSHADWAKRDPLLRFGRYLAATGVLPSPAQDAARDRLRDAIRTAIAEAETAAPPPASSLVEDVFARPTWLLEEQQAELGRSQVRRGSRETSRTS